MRHSIEVSLFACALIGCGRTTPPPSAPTTTAAATAVNAPDAPASASHASTVEGPPAPAPRCRLTVTDTEGCGTADVEALVAPVRTRIEGCRGTSGGKVRIRVRNAAGKLAFDVEPDSSLNPTEKQCVIDALSTIHADETSTAWSGLYIRPTGFTSLITIEW